MPGKEEGGTKKGLMETAKDGETKKKTAAVLNGQSLVPSERRKE